MKRELTPKVLLVFLCFIFIAFPIFAQYTLSGSVSDTKGNRLAGASIYLICGDSLSGILHTDPQGTYRAGGLAGGVYQIFVECNGYDDHQEQLLIEKNITRDFQLWEELTTDLSAVTIVADRSNVIGQTHSGTLFHLSATARNSKNVADALKEIPQLFVDDTNNTIRFNDGSNPLILINGMRRGEAMKTIDPQDILSVEIIETPSAKYMAEGFTGVINIRIKEQPERYRQANLTTQHDPGLSYGATNGGYELGGSNYSFYVSGKQFYFNKNHSDEKDYQQSLASVKNSVGRYSSDYLHYSGNLGGDLVISPRNYLSYSTTFTYIPTKAKGSGEGYYQEEDHAQEDFLYRLSNTRSSFISSSSLLFQHTFPDKSYLELLAGYTANYNRDWDEKEETGEATVFFSETDYKVRHNKGKVTVDYNFRLLGHEAAVGSQFAFEKNDIINTQHPTFYQNNRNEYLYLDVANSLPNGLSYNASVGMNIIYNQSAGIGHHYTMFSPTVSVNYRHKSHSWRLNYNRSATLPDAGYLNPYNTSTDSLYRIVGNPYLEAYPVSRMGISYTFSKNNLYLQPQLHYVVTDRSINETGYYDGDIYVRTFANTDKNKLFMASLNSRLTFTGGFVGVNLDYRNQQFYTGTYEMFKAGFNWRASYKAFTFNGHIDYAPTTYSATMKYKSTSESLATLTWDINRNWGVNLGMRYFLERKETQRWFYGENYERYTFRGFDERKNMVLIGAKYKWSYKNKQDNRKKRILNTNEGRMELIR